MKIYSFEFYSGREHVVDDLQRVSDVDYWRDVVKNEERQLLKGGIIEEERLMEKTRVPMGITNITPFKFIYRYNSFACRKTTNGLVRVDLVPQRVPRDTYLAARMEDFDAQIRGVQTIVIPDDRMVYIEPAVCALTPGQLTVSKIILCLDAAL